MTTLKEKVELIKKMAQDFDEFKTPRKHVSSPGENAFKPHGGGGGVSAIQNQDISQMQTAIFNLARSVSTVVPQGQQPDSNKEAINAFIQEHHNVAMPEGIKIDGIWGPITNRNVLNAFELAQAIQKAESNLAVSFDGVFTVEDLDKMRDLVSDCKIDPKTKKVLLTEGQKTEKAKELTTLINKVGSSYISLIKKFTSSPHLMETIKQDVELEKYKASEPEDKITERDSQVITPQNTVKVNIAGQERVIPLTALVDQKSFEAFLKQQGASDQEIKQKGAIIAKEISDKLSAMSVTQDRDQKAFQERQ